MDGRTAWSAESRAAFDAVAAATAALAAFTTFSADRDADPFRGVDPLRDLADDCLDGLTAAARLEASAAALKVRLAADYVHAARALTPPSLRDTSCQEMSLTAEVAGVLTVSGRSAGAFLGVAEELTSSLPLTLAALQAGTISWQHARIMVEETANLDREGAAGLEAHFLDPGAPNPARGCPAGELVPGRLRAKARLWRERHHPVSIEERHTKCAGDRRVEFIPDSDGMAWFSAYLPADTAAGIWDRTTTAARTLQGPDEARTLTQLRADIAATLLLTGTTTGTTGETAGGTGGIATAGTAGTGMAGCGAVPVPRAQVLVTVPVLSLLGVSGEPAMLDGYGPIPPSMARRLVAEGAGSFYRVLIDPRDGAPLEIGRTRYRPTKAQRRWLSLRDGKCPFPGCNNASLDNDADHLLAWADGGITGISNLGQPCPQHHRLKHGSAWTPAGASKDKPPGWTSPSGREYASEQQDWEPPHWPDGLPETDADTATNADTFTDKFVDMDVDTFLNHGLPEDPGRDPDQDFPADPFPNWHLFTAAHPRPEPDTDEYGCPAPLDEPYPGYFLSQNA